MTKEELIKDEIYVIQFPTGHWEHGLNGYEGRFNGNIDAFGISARASIYLTFSKDPIRFPLGSHWAPPVEFLVLKNPPKPHEYSPVLMTGRYKTVGD